MNDDRPYPSSKPGWFVAWLLFFVALVLGPSGVSMRDSWGWDEATHAELPAVRMLAAAQAGRLDEASDVLLDCQQYPPAYPLLLSAVQAVTGPSELACRRTGRVLRAFAVLGAWLLVVEVLRRRRIENALRGRPSPLHDGWSGAEILAATLAPFFVFVSPLFQSYSGTLFLEVPFATASLFALRAWLRRRGQHVVVLDDDADAVNSPARVRGHRVDADAPQHVDGGLAREFAAGAWITLCVFTKWNYGLLLGLGIAADWLLEVFDELRARRVGRFALRSAFLALVPVLTFAWWFVLPLPRGLEAGALHRSSFLAFLQGNQDASMVTPWWQRLLDWFLAVEPGPRALLLLLLGLLLSLPWALRGAVRTLWLVLLASAIPVALHPFHLDRFLVPQLVLLACVAALGLSRWSPRARFGAACAWLAIAAFMLVAPTAEHAYVLQMSGLESPDPKVREYQLQTLADAASIANDRRLRTAGVEREVHDALLDAIAKAAGPTARVGWLGVNPELSPAAIHLGLLARGGDAERFRRDSGLTRSDGKPDMLITHEFVDPGWTDDQARGWARAFDVVFVTQPMDWKGRAAKEVLARYRDALLKDGTWKAESLVKVSVARPVQAAVDVQLVALRRRK